MLPGADEAGDGGGRHHYCLVEPQNPIYSLWNAAVAPDHPPANEPLSRRASTSFDRLYVTRVTGLLVPRSQLDGQSPYILNINGFLTT